MKKKSSKLLQNLKIDMQINKKYKINGCFTITHQESHREG